MQHLKFMHTSSPDTPPSFFDFSLDERLLRAIDKLGFDQPTLVQSRTIPLALEHIDLLVSAETGSGKTAAFLLPALQHLLALPSFKFGTRVLVLSPTRELAQQIYQHSLQLAEFTDLHMALITGGDDFKQQQNKVRKNAEIIIATPGRLLEHLEQDSPNLDNLEILILDEADRMLDMGFSEDVLSIAEHCNTQRQTLLFSATLSRRGLMKMADKVLKNPELIALNSLQDEHAAIEQQIIPADDNEHKQKLLAWLLQNENYNKALVFTNTKIRAESLQGPLRGQKLRVGVLHGDLDQKDRNRVMELFRQGEINILIATDLAARGLDIPGINLVINFDMPRTGIEYIHRTGRTGRAEERGLTIALVKSTEWNLMAGIERFLKRSFKRRSIKELAGAYKGPKKLKASGKAVGGKKKKEDTKKTPVEKVKVRHRDKKNIGKRRTPSNKTVID
jgi:ATP-dependent RNA helicase SrmB